MIRLATSCSQCGSFDAPASNFTLFFDTEAGRFAFRVSCPLCGDAIRRAVTDDIATALLTVGVPAQIGVEGSEAEIATFRNGLDGDWFGTMDQSV